MTLAPQNEKAEKLVGEGSEEASESGRPVWSAVHVVQVHIGSNYLQREGFGRALAKHLDGWGSRPGAWNPICTVQSSGADRAFVYRGTWGAREYLVSCVNAIRGSRDPVAGACCRSHLQNPPVTSLAKRGSPVTAG